MANRNIVSNLTLKIVLKLWKDDGKIKTYHSRKTKRIFSRLKAEDFSKALLKVFYGRAKTNSGKIEPIVNSGTYFSKGEAHYALSAFTEKSLIEETEEWINESSAPLNSHKAIQTSSSRNRE